MSALSPFQSYYVVIADFSFLKSQRPGDNHAIPGDITTSLFAAHDQFLSAYRDALEYGVQTPRAYEWRPEAGTSIELTTQFSEYLADELRDLDEAAADLKRMRRDDCAADLRHRFRAE